MNRLKLWLYMLVFLGAGAANLYVLSQEMAERSITQADRDLAGGVSAFRAGEQLTATRTAAVTALAARDAALLEALATRSPEPDQKKKGKAAAPPAEEDAAAEGARQATAEAAAKAAVERAASALGIELPASATWAVANPEWLARPRLAEDGPQKEVVEFLRAAAAGTPRRGYARVNDSLWYGVGLPAGQGSALVLFLPLDAAWAARLKSAAGCDVTLDAGTPQLVTTVPGTQARALVTAGLAAKGSPAGVGKAPPVQVQKPVPFKAPLLFVPAPATRVLAVPLAGLPGGHLVLSEDTARTFEALGQYQWTTITVLAGLLLVGLLLGVIMKTEIAPQVPEPLLAAAARIERGDFSARAPALAGKLGTVVAALNRAAEVAQVAHAPPAPAADPFSYQPEPEPVFEIPPRPPAPPPAPEPLPPPAPYLPPPRAVPEPPAEALDDTQRLDGGPGVAARAAGEGAFASESFAARPVPRSTVAVTAVGMTAAAMPAVGQALGPPPEQDEDGHWRAVHAEFLRVRAECGEPTEGLGFDRFRPKLEKNRDALIAKYACRTVRFQVYVKEGKAALKATPVR
jgi:hypothetical protein